MLGVGLSALEPGVPQGAGDQQAERGVGGAGADLALVEDRAVALVLDRPGGQRGALNCLANPRGAGVVDDVPAEAGVVRLEHVDVGAVYRSPSLGV